MQKNTYFFLFEVSNPIRMKSANLQINKLKKQSNYYSFASFVDPNRIEEVQ
ncbi:hypothetical protein LEP1GSC047_2138 [Leptospira inadai serovar Lyme str. 10]|uniref:Uncharacterized protein n=1 Tax=Leptospira inadai serovar Lyme str. 10 TaxID=1049790 RepID=V6I0G7_9LEPT|nr:hypothetical protein LEP1GSC047_2138 [Leptospira inadai serovar Lyme str. 10]